MEHPSRAANRRTRSELARGAPPAAGSLDVRRAIAIFLFAALGAGCDSRASGCGSDSECGAGRVCVERACVDPPGLDGGAGDAAAPGTDGGGPRDAGRTSSDLDAPRILSFSTNATELDELETLIVTAVVTDPQGIEDLIGGTLRSPSGASYGAFSTSGEEGSYEVSLTWADVHRVEAIGFEYGDSAERELVAEFFDVAGHRSTQAVTITLHCSQGHAACDGTCTNTRYDPRFCGSCTPTPECSQCDDHICLMVCTRSTELTGQTSCDAVCAGRGSSCSADACINPAYHHNSDDCTGNADILGCSAPFGEGVSSARCCCVP